MIENYHLLKSSRNIILITLDYPEAKNRDIAMQINGERAQLSDLANYPDIENLKQIYNISDGEVHMRNGLLNGIYNAIALKATK